MSPAASKPMRGEVWYCDFSPSKGREQNGKRPALVVSADPFNRGNTERVVVCSITGHPPRAPLHVPIPAGQGGLTVDSSILVEQVRTVSLDRLDAAPIGVVSPQTLSAVSDNLKRLMSL